MRRAIGYPYFLSAIIKTFNLEELEKMLSRTKRLYVFKKKSFILARYVFHHNFCFKHAKAWCIICKFSGLNGIYDHSLQRDDNKL